MVGLGIVIIILILEMARFYLKNSVMQSLSLVICALFGFFIAMNFYEPVSNLLIYRGWIIEWAPGLVFAILHLAGMLIPYSLAGFLTGDAIDFGKTPKAVINVLCGAAFGLIDSGVFFMVVGLQVVPNFLPYSRYDQEAFNPTQSKAAIIPVDSMLTGLFSYVSSGSMSRGNEFGYINAGFLDKIYINHRIHRGQVAPCVGKDSLTVRGEDVEFDEKNSRLRIMLNLKTNSISEGGVRDKDGQMSFFPAQARLAVPRDGQTEILYPAALRTQTRVMSEKEMNQGQIISLTREDVVDGMGKVQIAYEVSAFPEGAVLQFKNNGYVPIPRPKPQE